MSALSGSQISFLLGGTPPGLAPGTFVSAVEEIEVTQAATPVGRDAFRVVLGVGRVGLGAVEYDLLDTGLLDPLNRLAAVVLVGGTPFGLVDGVIFDHQFAPSEKPGDSKLVITGEDVTAMMDLDEKNQTFPNLPDGLIAMKVVGGYAQLGLVPPVVTSPGPVETILTALTTQTETDFAFLARLAARNGNAFYAEPTPVPAVSKVTWAPEIRLGLPQSALTMNFETGTTVRCVKFHLDALAPRQVSLPSSGSPVSLGGLAGSLSGMPLATSPQEARRKRMARDSAKLSSARAQARLAEGSAASPDALVAEGVLDVVRYGQPLRPRQLVGVRGIGPAHGGLYYVRQVTHRVRPRVGEYLQRFTLVREGRGTTTAVVRP
jgi:hypothetical protein